MILFKQMETRVQKPMDSTSVSYFRSYSNKWKQDVKAAHCWHSTGIQFCINQQRIANKMSPRGLRGLAPNRPSPTVTPQHPGVTLARRIFGSHVRRSALGHVQSPDEVYIYHILSSGKWPVWRKPYEIILNHTKPMAHDIP